MLRLFLYLKLNTFLPKKLITQYTIVELMGDIIKTVELHEESIVDDDIIVAIEEEYDDDEDFIECMDCVQRKSICFISILFVGTILFVFLRAII